MKQLGHIGQRRPILVRRSLRVAADLATLSLAYWLAFLVRFDGGPPLQMWKLLVFTWPYVVALQFGVLHAFAIPRIAWSYVGLREAARMLWAVAAGSAALLAVRLTAVELVPAWGYVRYAIVPIGVIAADFALAFLGVLGVRVLRRIQSERAGLLRAPRADKVPTLLIGAGRAGALVAKEMTSHPGLHIEPVGFLDDDRSKRGLTIHGVTVQGSSSDLPEVVRRTGALQAVITITNATGSTVREIVGRCEAAGIPVKVIPGIYQILEGKVNLSRMRDVSIEDLLGREQVQLDTDLLSGFLEGQRVLVTGAGGSIGSEICRQVARFRPAALVLLDQAEPLLFEIHSELRKACPELELTPVVADVCDQERLATVFARESPEVVFHAAAHKHVPMMEWNPGEAVKNNVFGTKVVADTADRFDVGAFVMVSTDKAVNPTSIMGATKRLAEMYVQALSSRSKTKFVAVRFGNVLGSTGSVVPIFKAQIAEGGPVTVTHPDMVRYFMTIPEASQLVMQAAAMGDTGQIFVLDMGEPVKIVDLARELIRLSGFEPDREIEIHYTGTRPGEKLFEELAFDSERVERTHHEKIYIGKLLPYSLSEVERRLGLVAGCTSGAEPERVRALLQQAIPEMQRPSLAPLPMAKESLGVEPPSAPLPARA